MQREDILRYIAKAGIGDFEQRHIQNAVDRRDSLDGQQLVLQGKQRIQHRRTEEFRFRRVADEHEIAGTIARIDLTRKFQIRIAFDDE